MTKKGAPLKLDAGARALGEKLGMPADLGKASAPVVLKHRAVPMPPPGSHAALLKRLYGK